MVPAKPKLGLPGAGGTASPWLERVHLTCWWVFLAHWTVVWLAHWTPLRLWGDAGWSSSVLTVLVAATTLTALARQLPVQNVALAAFAIGLLGSLAHWLGGSAGLPVGPPTTSPLPWQVAVLWVVFILNARGVARLILRRHRGSPVYGFWVLGLTVGQIILLKPCFEAYALHAGQASLGDVPEGAWASAKNLGIRGVTTGFVTLAILALVTSTLISKHPHPSEPGYHPLVVWLLLSAWVLTAGMMQQDWLTATVAGIPAIAILSFVIIQHRTRDRAER